MPWRVHRATVAERIPPRSYKLPRKELVVSRMAKSQRCARLAAILASLAIAVLVSTPFLLQYHHHSDFHENPRCAICVFACAHVTPPSAPQALAPPPVKVTVVATAAETLSSSFHVRTPSVRGPPRV